MGGETDSARNWRERGRQWSELPHSERKSERIFTPRLLTTDSAATHSSGDDTGGLIRFGVEAKTPVAPLMSLTATVGASYADADYMDAYFSVTPAQSAASSAGLPAYEADAGIKDAFFGVTTDVPLSRDWSLKLSGRYSRLVGDAADSPIVENENQFYGGASLLNLNS